MTAGRIDADRLGVHYLVRRSGRVVRALDEVSLAIDPGDFVCLLGPSGCGKTTLLNVIAGFVSPTEGTVTVDGKPIRGPGPDRGMVFQQYGLFPWFTVEENIQYGPRLRGLAKRELAEISARYIALVQLSGFERAYPMELSGGMQQRVGIARALANDPAILLMDEPFAALDAMTRERMQDELLRILGQERRTCLFVTHSIAEATFLADRVILMTARPGRVKRDLAITLPRPRERTSEGFFAFYREIDALLRDEIDRAAGEGDGGG